MGYILRLTALNRYDTPSWILRMAINRYAEKRVDYAFYDDLNLSRLAQLTNRNKDELSSLLYQPVTPSRKNIGDLLLFGSPVPRYVIRPLQSKICPGCLRESEYIRKIWDLAPVTVCPLHQCSLLDECLNCCKRISWTRSGISYCSCKFDWRECELPVINVAELKVAQQIHRICNLPSTFSIENKHNSITNPLYSLNLSSLLSALFFIAGQYKGIMDTKGKHLGPSIRNTEIHTLLSKAWSAFEEWPNNYFAFLDWRRLQTRETRPMPGLHKEFAQYRHIFYKQSPSSPLKFMQDAFEEYLVTRWDGGYISHLSRLSETARRNSKYASKEQAKDLLRVSVGSVDDLIVAGKLKAIVRKRGRCRVFLIERSSLLEFKFELDHSLHFKQTRQILGVYDASILELINSDLLNPLRGPQIDGCSDWRFSKKEVENILKGVRKRVNRLASPKGNNKVSFEMARRKLIRVDVRIGQFVRAILEGKIYPCGLNKKKDGLAALLFSKEQVADYAREQRRELKGETLTVPEVAKRLNVTTTAVYFLIRKGAIRSLDRSDDHFPDTLITEEALEQFKSFYILPAKVARQLGTVSGYLTNLLISNGVKPISGRKIDGGCVYVFRKSDLNKIDVAALVAAAKLQTAISGKTNLQKNRNVV